MPIIEITLNIEGVLPKGKYFLWLLVAKLRIIASCLFLYYIEVTSCKK